jgi:hypothetical protein
VKEDVSPSGICVRPGATETPSSTAGITVTTEVPNIRLSEGSVAVIVDAPVATAVTTPTLETVASEVRDDDQVTCEVMLAVVRFE